MSASPRSLRRWFKSTSNRTFVVWPLALLALQALLDGGWPRLNLWALPLLAWGYAQYRWVGALRTKQGGGGPGLSNPPLRLVTTGPYRLTRNPMYLGHLIFFVGLALLLSGSAWVVFAAHVLWFDRRARGDEAHLLQLFGEPYRDYLGRVKRWVPGIS
ncbi:MAG: isoprenylcysteine carboxylmethyltransferase family protein [Nitrosomonadaceae bacterium]|nr:isoprenylcysteine carboxylmethyltransferase family protein [Nitrosomonadaceae bacterium]